MSDLYAFDASLEISASNEKIRSLLETGENPQREINTYTERKTYQYFRSKEQKQYCEYTKKLHCQFIDYLGESKEQFQSSFRANYRTRIFELVMANFANEKFY